MFSCTSQTNPNIRCHVIQCDTFQGYVSIELQSKIMKIISTNNHPKEEIKLFESPKATEVAYKDNNTIPIIILADSVGNIKMWEFNPSEYKWYNTSDRLEININSRNIIMPYITSYENKVVIIYRITLDNYIKFQFLIINLDNKKMRYIKEFEPSSPIIVPPTSYILVMNDLFITINVNVIKITFDEDNYNFEYSTFKMNNPINNALYIPDKDLPYLLFVTRNIYNGKSCDITCLLTDVSTILSESFVLTNEILSITYNDGIILSTLKEGDLLHINPLTKKFTKINCVYNLISSYYINDHFLYVKSNEDYITYNNGIFLLPGISFHAFTNDRTITNIYSENGETIIVESDERNQKIFCNSRIIGYCNKNSRIELSNENNINYYDNEVNNITLEIIKYNYVEIEEEEEEEEEEEKKEMIGKQDNNNNNRICRNGVLINHKNRLKICDECINIIYCQLMGNYLYSITSDGTITKWKYDNSKETFSVEYSYKRDNCEITFASGNRKYLFVYNGSDNFIKISSINCFDNIEYNKKMKPISVLYVNDYNQVYIGNNMGMVKKFELRTQNHFDVM